MRYVTTSTIRVLSYQYNNVDRVCCFTTEIVCCSHQSEILLLFSNHKILKRYFLGVPGHSDLNTAL